MEHIVVDTTPPPERQCCGCRHWNAKTTDYYGDARCRRRKRYRRNAGDIRNAYDVACGWYTP